MELMRQLEEQKRTIEALQQQRPQVPPASSPSASSWQPLFIPCDLNQPSSSSSYAFEPSPITPPAPLVSSPVSQPSLSDGAAQTQWTQQNQTAIKFAGGNS
jgi:hypothetical protein